MLILELSTETLPGGHDSRNPIEDFTGLQDFIALQEFKLIGLTLRGGTHL